MNRLNLRAIFGFRRLQENGKDIHKGFDGLAQDQ
jgi:hypothetical protein